MKADNYGKTTQSNASIALAEFGKMGFLQQISCGITLGLAISIILALVYMAEHGLMRTMTTIQLSLLAVGLAGSVIACIKYHCLGKFVPTAAGTLFVLGLDFWFMGSHTVTSAVADAAPGTIGAQMGVMLQVIPAALSWGILVLIPGSAMVYCMGDDDGWGKS